MCQELNSCNLVNKTRYNALCKLYNRYKLAVKIALDNVYEKPIADTKVNEIDVILQEIERYPISWSFYRHQSQKFSIEFENLIVFMDDQYLNID